MLFRSAFIAAAAVRINAPSAAAPSDKNVGSHRHKNTKPATYAAINSIHRNNFENINEKKPRIT